MIKRNLRRNGANIICSYIVQCASKSIFLCRTQGLLNSPEQTSQLSRYMQVKQSFFQGVSNNLDEQETIDLFYADFDKLQVTFL